MGDTVIDGDVDVAVAPVACDDIEDENKESENADPAVVDAVLWGCSGFIVVGAPEGFAEFCPNENDDATPDISVAPAESAPA